MLIHFIACLTHSPLVHFPYANQILFCNKKTCQLHFEHKNSPAFCSFVKQHSSNEKFSNTNEIINERKIDTGEKNLQTNIIHVKPEYLIKSVLKISLKKKKSQLFVI